MLPVARDHDFQTEDISFLKQTCSLEKCEDERDSAVILCRFSYETCFISKSNY